MSVNFRKPSKVYYRWDAIEFRVTWILRQCVNIRIRIPGRHIHIHTAGVELKVVWPVLSIELKGMASRSAPKFGTSERTTRATRPFVSIDHETANLPQIPAFESRNPIADQPTGFICIPPRWMVDSPHRCLRELCISLGKALLPRRRRQKMEPNAIRVFPFLFIFHSSFLLTTLLL